MGTNEIITELKQRSTKFMNWIELTVDDENAIKAAINYFEFAESALKAIKRNAEIDLAAAKTIDLENSSLNALKSTYKVNVPFNKESADKRYRKGLDLILTEGYTYNGMYFEKGTKRIWG